MSLTPIDRNRSLLVVDASVAVKWYLQDEDLAQESQVVRGDLMNGRIEVIVPEHFRLEASNAIRNALRPRRLSIERARTAFETVASLPVQSIPLLDLIEAGFESALSYDCALYDALYLTLAEQIGCPLIHADRRLRNTLAGRFPRELWIEDYAAE